MILIAKSLLEKISCDVQGTSLVENFYHGSLTICPDNKIFSIKA